MKARYKIAFCFVAAFLFVISAFPAAATSAPSTASARGFALYNVENNLFIMQKNVDEVIYPSSTVKIMTGLVAADFLSGRLNEEVTLTDKMLSGGGYLTVGKTLKIRDLFVAALSGRYNDAATALAVISCGNTADFVAKMNEKAQSLGMEKTNYTNVTGLHDAKAATTVRDTVKLCVAASKVAFLLDCSSEFVFDVTYSDGSSTTGYNNNQLVNKNSTYYCRSAKGLNSGYTDEGGYALATYASSKGASYVLVYIGEGGDQRFALAQDALQYAYDNYGYKTLAEVGGKVGVAEVDLSGSKIEMPVLLASNLRIYENKDDAEGDYVYDLRFYEETLVAPVKKGDTVGVMTVWQGNRLLGACEVEAGADAETNGFVSVVLAMKNYFTGRAFIAALVASVLIVVISFISMFAARHFKNKKRVYVKKRDGFKLK
ncbi:MAG: D-alanyl-D-alanine carboxypeptidase [Clostridia bacterium]|nr:D-alanyl-D-alanine carboxypeptidase [Clostridia bacterium]